MLTTSEVATWVPGQRRCSFEYYSADWLEDPCCNPAKAFEQCCALRDVRETTTLIDSATPAEQCDASVSAQLTNALMSYSMAHKLRNDPAVGCAAERKKKFTSKTMDNLFKFMDTCYDILYEGKTKAGLETCNSDSECYTRCQASSRSHQPSTLK